MKSSIFLDNKTFKTLTCSWTFFTCTFALTSVKHQQLIFDVPNLLISLLIVEKCLNVLVSCVVAQQPQTIVEMCLLIELHA